jgi:hypothetical protein
MRISGHPPALMGVNRQLFQRRARPFSRCIQARLNANITAENAANPGAIGRMKCKKRGCFQPRLKQN